MRERACPLYYHTLGSSMGSAIQKLSKSHDFFKKIFIFIILNLCVCESVWMCVCASEYKCPQRSDRGRAGVMGVCEPSDIVAGN